jgi:1,4-dihydroxy-6-naphthoate synthase
MIKKLSLAFSPCPNDTFMFAALANGWIDTGDIKFEIILADIEELNRMAVQGVADISKMSFPAFANAGNHYVLLQSGSALGRGCGPLLISREKYREADISKLTIAIPGKMTTANLLLSIFFPEAKNKTEMVFYDIEDAILTGKCDAGVIIHENRFTYRQKNLLLLSDLGKKWEETMQMPLPLGCIAGKKVHEKGMLLKTEKLIRQSIEYAYTHPENAMPYVRRHAQEMDEQVMKQHIELYVNRHSIDLGAEGKQAVIALLNKGHEAGLLPSAGQNVFLFP